MVWEILSVKKRDGSNIPYPYKLCCYFVSKQALKMGYGTHNVTLRTTSRTVTENFFSGVKGKIYANNFVSDLCFMHIFLDAVFVIIDQKLRRNSLQVKALKKIPLNCVKNTVFTDVFAYLQNLFNGIASVRCISTITSPTLSPVVG
jgi:hypothetical protein